MVGFILMYDKIKEIKSLLINVRERKKMKLKNGQLTEVLVL